MGPSEASLRSESVLPVAVQPFNRQWQSEMAAKCEQHFEKNRKKLFTFLGYDGVPWNNNNAEHAMKAFAALRDVIEGTTTASGIEEYLVLLTSPQNECTLAGVALLFSVVNFCCCDPALR